LSHIEIGYPEKKITVIPNGFDPSKYCPKPESRQLVLSELNIPNDVFLVGLMARFDPVKNHIGFIRAASVLYKKNSKVHFILSGFGVDWDNEELVTIIDSLGLNSIIHMLGYRDDMPHLISSLDLFVSSSHGEAFPLVVGEAMSCEVPCVVTDVGDSAYLVGSTGKVVKPDDMHSLANAMEEILQMESKDRKYLGVKARRRIMENFNIEAVTKKYKNFYENVVTKGI
jgi:glycosyltransferase involved in cell wall biosynthesis